MSNAQYSTAVVACDSAMHDHLPFSSHLYHHIYLPLLTSAYTLYESYEIPVDQAAQQHQHQRQEAQTDGLAQAAVAVHLLISRLLLMLSLTSFLIAKCSNHTGSNILMNQQQCHQFSQQYIQTVSSNLQLQLPAQQQQHQQQQVNNIVDIFIHIYQLHGNLHDQHGHASTLPLAAPHRHIYYTSDCTRCNLSHRPPPTHHCSHNACEHCIYRFAHHCYLLNTDLHSGNTRWFIAFLYAHLIMILYGCYIHYTCISYVTKQYSKNYKHSFQSTYDSAQYGIHLHDHISTQYPITYTLTLLCLVILSILLYQCWYHTLCVLHADNAYQAHKREQRVLYAEQQLQQIIEQGDSSRIAEAERWKDIVECMDLNEWDTGSYLLNFMNMLRGV